MAKAGTTRRGGGTGPQDHYQAVTDRIVAALEAGTLPWRRPWVEGVVAAHPGMPCNAATGRAYRGINAVLLAMTQLARGSGDPRWLTYKQAADRGWQVRAGERGTPVVFFKRLEMRERPAGGGEGHGGAGEGGVGEPAVRRVPLLRGFTAFHASQVDGIPAYRAPTVDEAPWRKPEAPELIVARSGVPVRTGGDRAFYSPALDLIGMPPAAAFRAPEGYAATLLHELGHATAHASRLGRDLSGRFGSREYACEELVAELASCFAGSVLGVTHEVEGHASYLQSWLGVLREDRRAIFRAAAAAQKAADWMLALHPDHARSAAGDTPGPDEACDGEEAAASQATIAEVA